MFSGEPGAWTPLPRIHIEDWDRPVPAGKVTGSTASAAYGRTAAAGTCTTLNPLARLIDHTVLKPETTEEEILAACDEARKHHFCTVCIPPTYVAAARKALAGSEVKVCTVIGFPLGYQATAGKVCETQEAVKQGAVEIDMVLNIGLLKSGQFKKAEEDIRAVRAACSGKVLKVILENCLLTDQEKIEACKLAVNAGADFVKTSTGFAKSGATVEDIQLMRKTVGPQTGVKAAGGIREEAFAKELVAAGATRLGTSASVALVSGQAVVPSAPKEGSRAQFLPY